MSAKNVGVTPRPYPYNLDLVEDPEAIRKLDPWHVLEFFRREALLRSQRVQHLYTRQNERTLQREYGLKWKCIFDCSRICRDNFLGFIAVHMNSWNDQVR